MIDTTIEKIAMGLVWVLAGVGWSFYSFKLTQKTVAVSFDQTNASQKILAILGSLLKWLLMLGLMYVSLRMGILYSLCFVLSLTIAQIGQVVRFNQKFDRDTAKERDQ